MSPQISIELPAGTTYEPGDEVTGTVTVTGGDKVRELVVSLVYVERTQDYSAVGRTGDVVTAASGPIPDGRPIPFELLLPADALPGLPGGHGTLGWEVQAKADRPGLDTMERRPVRVSPLS